MIMDPPKKLRRKHTQKYFSNTSLRAKFLFLFIIRRANVFFHGERNAEKYATKVKMLHRG